MDWLNLEPDRYALIDRHFTPGRDSYSGVTLHHMAGDLSIDGCYSTWMAREASAHYAVQSDGTIGQLVNDWDTAWACGDTWANRNTISIEHANDRFGPWTVNETVLDQGAHLTAAICLRYGLGRPEWMVNVFPHSHFQATACPGELAGSQNAEYMARAQAWYDSMAGGAEPPAPAPSPSPEPSASLPPIRYAVSTDPAGAEWLPDMLNRECTAGSGDDYAGNGEPMRWLAMDFPGWYQVRTEASGWLPPVRKFDKSDLENGVAGDGSPITGARAYYETPDPDSTGWVRIRYALADVGEGFLPEMEDLADTGGSGDNFAGNGGRASAFYAYPVRA